MNNIVKLTESYEAKQASLRTSYVNRISKLLAIAQCCIGAFTKAKEELDIQIEEEQKVVEAAQQALRTELKEDK